MPVIQRHHIFYKTIKEGNKRESQREVTIDLFQHEHRLLTQIQRLKPENTSKGFWHALRVIMEAYEPFSKEVKKVIK